MRIAIIGTGALASVYAARLAGHADVCMFGTWPEGVAAIRANGVHVVEPDGRLWRAEVPVYASTGAVKGAEGANDGEDAAFGSAGNGGANSESVANESTTDDGVGDDSVANIGGADIVLVLVKSYQTLRAAEWAAELLAPDGLAVTLQNGLDNYEALVEEVGEGRVAVGVTYNAATMLAPAEVRHVAHNSTYLGITPGTEARLRAFADVLDRAGLETQLGEDIESRLWGKAVVNAAINPLTALWRVPNGALLTHADRRWLLTRLAEEAAHVAQARGLTLPFEDPVEYAESVCRSTAANHSSMLQDIERDRPTEIESINGIIIAEGKRLGVHVGVNEVIWRLLRAF